MAVAHPAEPTTQPRTGSPEGSLWRLYGLFLRHQLTLGRVLAIIALGAATVVAALIVRVGAEDRVTDSTEFMNFMGFLMTAPICTLVFASSCLGDTVADRTLVYLWLTPVSRRRIATAAVLASITVTLPLVFVPLVIAAAATGGGGALIGGTAVATIVGVIGYAGVFTTLGLRFRFALVWGIAYIVLWEGFVATASTTAAKLSLRAYTASILSQFTGVGLRLSTLTIGSAIVVPIVLCVAFTFLTARILDRMDID